MEKSSFEMAQGDLAQLLKREQAANHASTLLEDVLEAKHNLDDRLEVDLEEAIGCCSTYVERASKTRDSHLCLFLDLDVVCG